MIIMLIIIIISLGKLLLSYISNTPHTHTVVIITHYKRMGYVIIHKPNCSGRECINSRPRFDLLLFCRFGSICRRCDHSYRRSGCRCSVCHWRPTVTLLQPLFVAGRWCIEINTRAGDTVSANYLVFFAYKKIAH